MFCPISFCHDQEEENGKVGRNQDLVSQESLMGKVPLTRRRNSEFSSKSGSMLETYDRYQEHALNLANEE